LRISIVRSHAGTIIRKRLLVVEIVVPSANFLPSAIHTKKAGSTSRSRSVDQSPSWIACGMPTIVAFRRPEKQSKIAVQKSQPDAHHDTPDQKTECYNFRSGHSEVPPASIIAPKPQDGIVR